MSRKIFVGSLPHNIDEATLRSEFQKHGTIESIFVKQGCEVGRQWAFVTYGDVAQAQQAKDMTDRKLTFPGGDRPCDVTIAKNQGRFGQDPLVPKPVDPLAALGMQAFPAMGMQQEQRKIFVGSLPDNITEDVLRAEFSKYGPITDFFLKTGCEPGRQWSFITFQTVEQANTAKSSADRTLVLPGADRACEVMIAKNQGKGGADPVAGAGAALLFAQNPLLGMAMGGMGMPGMLPPPPQWQTYYTTAGMPYYHNAGTGVTQWEAPPEMAMQQQQQQLQQQQLQQQQLQQQQMQQQQLQMQQQQFGVPPQQFGMPQQQFGMPPQQFGMDPALLPLPAPAAVQPAAVPIEAALPEGWAAHTDAEGRTFYFNAATNVSQWDRPTAVPLAAPAAVVAAFQPAAVALQPAPLDAGAYGAAVQPSVMAPGPYGP